MRTGSKELNLQLERPVHPWHIVDGDGKTWIILRRQITLAESDVAELGQLVLESNTYELIAADNTHRDRFLYRGKLCLRAYYKSRSIFQLNPADPKTIYDEHEAYEQLRKKQNCPVFRQADETKRPCQSVFPSRIYDETNKIPSPVVKIDREESFWLIEMPWQAWLQGGELQGGPEVMLVHYGQSGLGTLLCEVLLCLSAVNDAAEEQFPGKAAAKENCFLLKEEFTFALPCDCISKVIGNAVKRAFPQIKPGKQKSLELEYLTKINLIFLSTHSGGERIHVASGLVPRCINLPLLKEAKWPRFLKKIEHNQVTLVKTNEQKAAMQLQAVIVLEEEEPPVRQTEQQADIPPKLSPEIITA